MSHKAHESWSALAIFLGVGIVLAGVTTAVIVVPLTMIFDLNFKQGTGIGGLIFTAIMLVLIYGVLGKRTDQR